MRVLLLLNDGDRLMQDDEFMQTLRQLYAGKLPEKLHEINSQWEMVLAAQDNEKLKILHNTIHKFCGSSGSYGYPEISQVTRGLEMYLKTLIQQDKPLSVAEKAEIQELLQKIQTVVESIIANKKI